MNRLILFVGLALAALPVAAQAQVTWQAPVEYAASPPAFTAMSLPGTMAYCHKICGIEFKLPSPQGMPVGNPFLACFETNGTGGMSIAAPAGTWLGIASNKQGVLSIPWPGVGVDVCVWSDGAYWHAEQFLG